MTRFSIFVFFTIFLVACENHYAEYAPSETDVLSRPWLKRDNPAALEPVYCYKTLVELECFDKAQAGTERPAVWTYQPAKN